MAFNLNNVNYQISLSNTKSEDDGVIAQRYKAELQAGPKKVILEKILQDGDVQYTINGEGPGMDNEDERKRFLRTWAGVVIGQLHRHAREMNETDQNDQFKQSITSFLKLYKHFFEPRVLSLLQEENLDSSTSTSDESASTLELERRAQDEDSSSYSTVSTLNLDGRGQVEDSSSDDNENGHPSDDVAELDDGHLSDVSDSDSSDSGVDNNDEDYSSDDDEGYNNFPKRMKKEEDTF